MEDYSTTASSSGSPVVMLFQLAFIAAAVAGMWKTFEKAGKPGWASIVPIYNTLVLLEIAGKPAWWILLMLVPFLNLIILFIVMIEVAKAFGKSAAFGVVALALFAPIGFLMLGFGDAKYGAPKAPAATPAA
jgi:hypothetical protein